MIDTIIEKYDISELIKDDWNEFKAVMIKKSLRNKRNLTN